MAAKSNDLPSTRRELDEMFELMTKDTHFQADEVEFLCNLFKVLMEKAGVGKGTITRVAFRDLLTTSFKMSDDAMMDRIVLAFAAESDLDYRIGFREFIHGMSVFLRGTLDEQIDFCFKVYDCMKRDGYITRDEMHQLLSPTIVNSPSEEDAAEAITELIDLLVKKMGDAKDPRIGKDSFRAAVEKDKLLLQMLGPCLPERKYANSFISQDTIDIYRIRY
mmetsp:Transcript_28736/g.75441  ORF Transcript_28736/g.75441 Transcript_28736/m.75441 type:complete len:220 (-) Transcript_28736:231-890(-)|eukprot:CAMPEP_0182926240 /NCGR_PEP_ID=MMETSP0105_2-20130417/11283_1 /TAXON_ID=81532 ORGANISM="Acanthoeca-like sp., Strain 10tr" /NCGR_SAMPLE_ID=MMETSP0105_2 /ASSEMBLY_ACC=CAM_ASM_000205 /LENGTH=219 /DNA_ID=CAMNT_0025064121 /DNA_START=61 /DNA_END=720 /DNA_ORIENTATION=-